jgi:hypothetical protein
MLFYRYWWWMGCKSQNRTRLAEPQLHPAWPFTLDRVAYWETGAWRLDGPTLVLERHRYESWLGLGNGFRTVKDEVYIYELAIVAGVRGMRLGAVTYRVGE